MAPEIPETITIIPGEGVDPPIVDTKSKTVEDGDVIQWVLPNNLAHHSDASPNVATTLRLRFIGANPTTGPEVTTSPIPAAGGADVDHRVTLKDPLPAGTYTYVLEILDQFGNVLCEIDPELVHVEPTPAPGLLKEGVVALIALLLLLGAVLVSRGGPLRTG
jgi:hypothetical protein